MKGKIMPKSEFVINLGPKYLQTQGLLKLVTVCDAEKIKSVEPVIGYSHRGFEKIAENLTYMQYLPAAAKISPLSWFMYQEAFCSAVEKLCNIEVPEKAEFIRVLLMEMNRISSHFFWFGSYLKDLGGFIQMNFCLDVTDLILDLFEKITGQRYSSDFFTFGGVKNDISNEILDEIPSLLTEIVEITKILNDLAVENPSFISRTANVGILTKQTALSYSITGVNLRASGADVDFRKKQPYSAYDKLDFDVPLRKTGDSYDRFVLRTEEILQSVKIVQQCVTKLKNTNGVFDLGINQIELIPEKKMVSSYVESSNGLVVCTIVSDGTNKPQRVKWRTASFYSVQILPLLLKNRYIADIMTIVGSFDINMSEADR